MSTNKRFFVPACALIGMTVAGCGGTQTGDTMGYNARTVDNTTVSSATSFGAATLGSKLLPIAGKTAFISGLNISSFSGEPSIDLGNNPLKPTTSTAYAPKEVSAAMEDIAGFGTNVIRVQLFSKLDGLKLDSNGLVTGIDDVFLKNISDMIDKAVKNKLQVYLCLTDSWAGNTTAKNPVSDTAARSAYLKKAVTPLIGKLRGREGVFAIDVFDEIESEIAGKDGNMTDKGVTWDQARDYLKATVEVIKSVDTHRLVSAGSGLHGTENIKAGKFSKLGFDFYDAHVYDDKASLPPAKELRVDRPVLIGSCGPAAKKFDSDLQASADAAFFTNALAQGYAGAILSDYSKSKDNPLSLLDPDGMHRSALARMKLFVSTQLPAAAAVSSIPPTGK